MRPGRQRDADQRGRRRHPASSRGVAPERSRRRSAPSARAGGRARLGAARASARREGVAGRRRGATSSRAGGSRSSASSSSGPRASARQRVERGVECRRASNDERSRSRRGRGKTLSETATMAPRRPRQPTMSFGRSKPAAFLTTLPPPRDERAGAVDEPHADDEVAHAAVAEARRSPTVPAATTPPSVAPGARQRRVERQVLAVLRQRRRRARATGVPASAVSVSSAGSYSTMPRRPETSSGDDVVGRRRRQRRLRAAADRQHPRAAARTASLQRLDASVDGVTPAGLVAAASILPRLASSRRVDRARAAGASAPGRRRRTSAAGSRASRRRRRARR